MRFPLARFTIVITGDFGKERTYEKMKQWTEANGGKFVRDLSRTVTHLVCSKEHFKGMAPLGIWHFFSTDHKAQKADVTSNSPAGYAHTVNQDRELRLVRRLIDAEEAVTRRPLLYGTAC